MEMEGHVAGVNPVQWADAAATGWDSREGTRTKHAGIVTTKS